MRPHSRIAPVALLSLALVLGGVLRLAHLGANEMSADEGASWAAANQVSAAQVLDAQRHLNPAELGLHDLVLHYWMSLFGSGLGAMRSLSALAGIAAITLTFAVTRELLELDDPSDGTDHIDLTAALAALIVAVNLITIKYSREMRMYPLMLALVLAQAGYFLHAMRHPTWSSYAITMALTALAIAAHPMALLIIASEGAWLLLLIAWPETRLTELPARTQLCLASALVVGVSVAGIAALPLLESSGTAVNRGLLSWVEQPAPWAPITLFNKGTGSVAFPLLAALAIWGGLRAWQRIRSAAIFALLWMWLPPLTLLILSYSVRPVFVERYLISSFIPFFMFAAIGIMELPSPILGMGAAALAVILSLGHVYTWSRKPHDTQWREGLVLALVADRGGEPISVAPGYAVNVVRYYLSSTQGAVQTAEADPVAANGEVLLLSDQSKGERAAKLTADYPHVAARVRGLEVRSR
jgi:mannosyltransferase